MGQIDSFKKVLGIAGQSVTGDAGIEVKEEKVPEVEPVKNKAKPTGGKSTLAVSSLTREEVHLLAFWARRQGLTHGETSEDFLQFVIKRFYKKHPESKAFVEQMRLK